VNSSRFVEIPPSDQADLLRLIKGDQRAGIAANQKNANYSEGCERISRRLRWKKRARGIAFPAAERLPLPVPAKEADYKAAFNRDLRELRKYGRQML
jgi:hypothetical protein